MVNHGFRTTITLSLAALAACAPAISSEWREEERKDLTLGIRNTDLKIYLFLVLAYHRNSI